MKTKTNLSVTNNAGIRVKPSIIVGKSGPFVSGDILDANSTSELISNLAKVAATGKYDDLENKPQIPVVPTNISSFSNDSNYITENDISSLRSSVQNIQSLIDADEDAVDIAIDKFEEIVDFLNGIEPGNALYNIINSHIDNGTSKTVKHVEVLTQELFNALLVKDPNTEYNII